MEHLIVGILLFTPLVALVPTMVVWYLFLTILHGAVVATRLVLYLLVQAMQHNPLHIVVRRIVSANMFPGQSCWQPRRLAKLQAGVVICGCSIADAMSGGQYLRGGLQTPV